MAELWGRQLEDAYLREQVVWVHECFMHMQKHLGNDSFVTHDRLLNATAMCASDVRTHKHVNDKPYC